jgi:prepilin-type N-terminal cleavage/methylation domain-containing protein
MRKGFTLLELIIVVIIIGILATIGFGQYSKVMEKGRKSEALSILGNIRGAEAAFYLENGAYTATLSSLYIETLPPAGCWTSFYFSYSAAAATGTGTAVRCQAGGKTPNVTAANAYSLTMNIDGAVACTGYCP